MKFFGWRSRKAAKQVQASQAGWNEATREVHQLCEANRQISWATEETGLLRKLRDGLHRHE